MLKSKITTLPGHIQSVFVQNIMKLYGNILKAAEESDDQDTMKELCQLLTNKLPIFVQSADLEVQERVGFYDLCIFYRKIEDTLLKV